MPGRYNRYWVQATKTGTFEITCTEYCGQNHSTMTSECVVETQEDFEKFLTVVRNPYITNPHLKVGEMLYNAQLRRMPYARWQAEYRSHV